MSEFLKLNARDWFRACFLVFLTSFGGLLYSFISTSGTLPGWPEVLEWLKTGGIAALAYLVKNLMTNSVDELGKPEGA